MDIGERRPRIALLGWGSLIWDERPEFDRYHQEWSLAGPILPLEFTRISETRKNALTLVIDPTHGADCQVAYTVSTRRSPADAIADLRCREGTILKRIGSYVSGERAANLPPGIVDWAKERDFDAVVWTDLPSNFSELKKREFSIEAAIEHLQMLTPEGKAAAAEYIWRAPAFVNTKLRAALQTQPWFASASVVAGA